MHSSPIPSSLYEAIHDAFVADPVIVTAFGHVESTGPHKFWRDEVVGGDSPDGPGVPVPAPYVVAAIPSEGVAGITFMRGFTRSVTVLLKTFATDPVEADRLGKLVAGLLNPNRDRPGLTWDGGSESSAIPSDGRTLKIPGRGGSGQQLYGRYDRFVVIVSGKY